MNSGYYYSPYIPLDGEEPRVQIVQDQSPAVDEDLLFQYQDRPIQLDPESFTPRNGVMARYSREGIREGERYYGYINLREFAARVIGKSVAWIKEGF